MWILQYLKKVADNIRNVIETSIKNVELISGRERLGEVKINRVIFQGNSLLPTLFAITLIPLSILLRDMKAGYMIGEFSGKISHLFLMNYLKLYGKTMQELDSLDQTVRIFNSDIGMQFGISKCAMLKMKRGKVVQCEGTELPNGELIKPQEDEKEYKYLAVLQFHSMKSKEMKDMITKQYYWRITNIQSKA